MLTDLGWGHRDGAPLQAREVSHGARDTIDVLESMAGVHRDVDRHLLARLGRATLFGLDTQPT